MLYVVYRRTEGKPLLQAGDDPRAPRCAASRAEPSTARSSCRCSATPLDDDIMQTAGRLAGEEQRPGEGEGADDRGAVGLRDADVAADRRARCPRAAAAAARRGAAPAPRRWGRSTKASRWRPRRCAPAAPAQAIVRRGATPRRRGDRAGGGGAVARSAAGRCSAAAAARWTTSSARSRGTSSRKAPCRVILTAPPADAPPTAATPAPVRGRANATRPNTDLSARRLLPSVTRHTRLESRRMFILIVGAGRVGSTVAKWRARTQGTRSRSSTRTRCRTSGSTTSSTPPGRRPADASRSAPRSEVDALTEAGIDRGRRVHRLDRRRQHQPRRRPDRPAALSTSRT